MEEVMQSRKKRILKRLLIAVAVFLCLAAVLLIVREIAYRHRSDPAGLKKYATDNPHITQGKAFLSAHRAGAGEAPEETLRAFKHCLEDNRFQVDYLEFDLRLTKDEVLVLLHDAELDRTSDCAAVFGREHCRPEEFTYEELRRLNMGAQFVNKAGEKPYGALSGQAVPEDLKILNLDEALDYMESNGRFRYIIEIKNSGELFLFYLCSLVNWQNYKPAFQVLQLPFNEPKEDYHINSGTVSIINYAHSHNLAVQYWTINNEEDASYLMSIGADAIITDYPEMIYRLRER